MELEETKQPEEMKELGKEDDHFSNLEKLRLSQDFAGSVGLKKKITTIPVRKPNRQDFIRVHPGDDYFIQTATIELKEERETFIVTQELWSELPGELVAKALYTTINTHGVLFLWPVRLPGEDGLLDQWNKSAHLAAEEAKKNWIRVVSDKSLGAYNIFKPIGNLAKPKWPELEFTEILRIAFKDKLISNFDHPVLKRLRGET